MSAFLNADTPAELQQAITQHPLLLKDEALDVLSARITEVEQDGDMVFAQRLHVRLGEVRRIRQQCEPRAHAVSSSPQERDDGFEQIET